MNNAFGEIKTSWNELTVQTNMKLINWKKNLRKIFHNSAYRKRNRKMIKMAKRYVG